MGGVDIRASKRFGLGPFVDLALGQFNHFKDKVNDDDVEIEIPNKASHQWLTSRAAR